MLRRDYVFCGTIVHYKLEMESFNELSCACNKILVYGKMDVVNNI